MGLLDFSGFVGDDTTKDEYGMTQADRRQPLWSGLFKAGMLGMAAGENITPGARAQLLGQVGGAIGDIPEAMSRQRTEAAQMQIRRQQFTTNQQKLDQQRKIQAYASSPEGQQALSSLSAPNQFAAKAALEAGDVDAFQRIITGAGAEAHRQKMEILAERRVGLQEEKADRKERETQENPFGNTYEGRMYNVLLRGKRDPKFAESDEYAAAWNHFNRDQRPVAVGNQTIIEPKLANIGDFPSPGAKPAPTSPAATPTPPVMPAPGEVRRDEEKKTRSWVNPSDPTELLIEYSDGTLKAFDAKTGSEKRREPPKPPDQEQVRKLADLKESKAKINDAAQQFLDLWKRMTPADRAKALAGAHTDAGSAWANFAAHVKGKSGFDLGVLNAGDRPFITQIVPDPTKLSSLTADAADVERSVGRVLSAIDAGIRSREETSRYQSRAPQSGGGKGKRTIDRWNAEKGKFEQVEVD